MFSPSTAGGATTAHLMQSSCSQSELTVETVLLHWRVHDEKYRQPRDNSLTVTGLQVQLCQRHSKLLLKISTTSMVIWKYGSFPAQDALYLQCHYSSGLNDVGITCISSRLQRKQQLIQLPAPQPSCMSEMFPAARIQMDGLFSAGWRSCTAKHRMTELKGNSHWPPYHFKLIRGGETLKHLTA